MTNNLMPLHRYPAFRASEFEILAGVLETQLEAKIERVVTAAPLIEVNANRLGLPLGELWFCSYGVPLTVKFPDVDCVRIQFQLKSAGATRVCGKRIEVTEDQACISEGGVDIEFGPDFQQVVWRAPRSTLVQKLAQIKGEPVTGDLEFEPALDLVSPRSNTLKLILRSLLQAADSMPGEAGRIVQAELEEAFVVSLLAASGHRHRETITRPNRSVAPWQVRRAEAYIAENWSKAITIDELVQATGVSARTLFRTFQQHRECSPMEFARRVRLQRARDLIQQPGSRSVTDVAFACGFGDLSQFSKSFALAFGESPSALRKRHLQRRN